MIAFPLYLHVSLFSCSVKKTKHTHQQRKIGCGLSLTWLLWFCSKSKITILKVDKVSRNPADHIMNVACLEIKSHRWFKDDTKKMASLCELCAVVRKKGRQQSHLSHDQCPTRLSLDDSRKEKGRNQVQPADKRDGGDQTPSVEEIRGRQSQQWPAT